MADDLIDMIQPNVQPGAFVPTSELIDGLHTAIRRYDMDAADRVWADLIKRGSEELLQNVDLLLKIPSLDRVYQRHKFAEWAPALEEVAAKALEQSPRDMRALKLHAGLLLDGAFKEARGAGDGDVDPVQFELVDADRRDAALAAVLTWKEVAPESSSPWVMEATIHGMAGEVEKEQAAYAKAVECNARDPDAWYRKAECHLTHRQPLDALYAIEKALELDKENEQYLDLREDCAALVEKKGDG